MEPTEWGINNKMTPNDRQVGRLGTVLVPRSPADPSALRWRWMVSQRRGGSIQALWVASFPAGNL